MTLEEEQAAMRKRQKARRGRKTRQQSDPQINHERTKKRISAYLMHCRGFSPAQIAAQLHVKLEAIEQFVRAGCPLL